MAKNSRMMGLETVREWIQDQTQTFWGWSIQQPHHSTLFLSVSSSHFDRLAHQHYSVSLPPISCTNFALNLERCNTQVMVGLRFRPTVQRLIASPNRRSMSYFENLPDNARPMW